MTLVDEFRAVLLRYSRSLVDQDGQPTVELLAELVGVAEGYALELATAPDPVPVPGRPVRRKRDETPTAAG